MAWMVWLSGPVVAGVLASLWAWWVNRPERQLNTVRAIRAHGRYLDDLVVPAAESRRVKSAETGVHATD